MKAEKLLKFARGYCSDRICEGKCIFRLDGRDCIFFECGVNDITNKQIKKIIKRVKRRM